MILEGGIKIKLKPQLCFLFKGLCWVPQSENRVTLIADVLLLMLSFGKAFVISLNVLSF